MKRFLLLFLVIILLVSSAACQSNTLPPIDELEPMQPPERTEVAYEFNAKLYYIMKDSGELSHEIHEVQIYNDEPVLITIMNKLLEKPKYDYHRNPIDSSYKLADIEVSEGVANVFFEGDAFNSNSYYDMKQYIETQAVILATLEPFGVNAVNVYINGVAPSYKSCPVGFAVKPADTLSKHISDTIDAYTDFSSLSEESPFTANCVIYVKDKSGYFLANKQHIVIKNEASNEELVRAILGRFLKLYNGVVSPEFTFTSIESNRHLGKYNISVTVEGNISDDSVLETLRAGIALTLTGYIPDLHYVTVIYENSSVAIQRKDYAKKIGGTVKVYYPYLLQDVLSVRNITISKGLACCTIKEFIEIYFASSVANCSIFTGMKEEYILDIYVNNGIAVLDLDKTFYEGLSKYINNENSIVDGNVSERLIIYGIVNSLTEVYYIDSVLFLCNGENIKTLKNVYLGAPLYKNIGLIYGA